MGPNDFDRERELAVAALRAVAQELADSDANHAASSAPGWAREASAVITGLAVAAEAQRSREFWAGARQ